jgi:triacylglycerol lipase
MFLVVAALALISAMPDVRAEQRGMPSEIEWRLAERGAVINPLETAKLYAPLQAKEPYADIKVSRDLKYGPDARNALDIFAPDKGGGPYPVLVFMHGGGFTAGDKRQPGSPFYDNIMVFAARNGMLGVNMTYRLAPQNPWPAAAEDIAAVVRWVRDNIAQYGGDARRVILMGHSVGAVHVAAYVAHPQFHGPNGSGIAGAILVSGFYDLTALGPGAPQNAYFGDDIKKYAERSSLAGLIGAKIPLLVVAAELDPPVFLTQARQLNDALCKAGRCPRYLELEKHNHMSEVYAINTDDTSLSDSILVFANNPR